MAHMGTFLIMTVIWIPVIVSLVCLPYFSRKTLLFGIAIMEEHYNEPDVRALRRKYVMGNLGVGLVWWLATFIVFQQKGTTDAFTYWMVWSVIAYLLLSFAILIYCHQTAKKLKKERGWDQAAVQLIAVDTSFHKRPSVVSNWWYLLHLALAAGFALLAVIFYDRFPDPIATHYDIHGQPDAYRPKTFWSVFTPSLVQLALVLLFVFSNSMIRRSKQQISVNNPERSREQNLRFRRIWSIFLMITGLILIAMLALIQFNPILNFTQDSMIVFIPLFPALIVVGSLALSFFTGQGGANLKGASGDNAVEGHKQIDHDKYWKLGMFYCNRNDPSLFVEKRIGIGWTFNIAHPVGLLLLLLPIVIVAIVIIVVET